MIFRLGASAVILVVALVWPFLSVTSHAPGGPIVDFGGGHGIDPVDLLSLPAIAAAIALSAPTMQRRRTRRRRKDEPNRTG
jgi:hypothetical protein